jgi:hypothetical protein
LACGISARTLLAGTLDLTLSHNTVTMDSASSQNGVTIASGSGGAGTVCVNPLANNVTATGSGMSGMLVEQLDPNSVFQIEGYDGSGFANYLEANNTLAGGAGGWGALATQAPAANGFSASASPCTGFGTT